MRCKTCEANGVKHKVFDVGTESNSGKIESFYDENDIYHTHYDKKNTYKYKCSEGHHFSIDKFTHPCSAIGCPFGKGWT